MSTTVSFTLKLLLTVSIANWCVSPSLSVPISGDRRRCNIDEINVQRNFDIRRLIGTWYDIARLSLDGEAFALQSPVSHYSIQDNGSSKQLVINYGGQLNGLCVRPIKATVEVRGQTDNAKLTASFDDYPDGFLRGAFWIVEMNNDYTLIYGCYVTRDDRSCEDGSALAYVISRRQTVQPNMLQRIRYILRHRLCVDPAKLHFSQHTHNCPPDESFSMQRYITTFNEVSHSTQNVSALEAGIPLISPVIPSSGRESQQLQSLPISANTVTHPVNDHHSPASEISKTTRSQQFADQQQHDAAIGTSPPSFQATGNYGRVEHDHVTRPDLHALRQPLPDNNQESAAGCPYSSIPTQPGFQLERFMGTWYTVASYTTSDLIIDSGVAELSMNADNTAIHLSLTGSSSGVCFPTFSGILQPSVENAAVMYGTYGQLSGPFRVVYMSNDYSYGLTYQCSDVNVTDQSCGVVTIDVIARSRRLTNVELSDATRLVRQLCVMPSRFRMVDHDVLCSLDVNCQVSGFNVQANVNWTKLSGRWYTVAMVQGTSYKVDSVTWNFKVRSFDKKILASYRAAANGQCLKPARAVLYPAHSGGSNVEVRYTALPAMRANVFTDHQQVIIWYECEAVDNASGACLPERTRLEILQRTNHAHGNLYLRHRDVIRKLCVDPKLLSVVTEEVECSRMQRCDLSNIVSVPSLDMTKFVDSWNVLATVSSQSAYIPRHVDIKPLFAKGLLAACISSSDSNQYCQTDNCFQLRLQQNGEFDVSRYSQESNGVLKVLSVDSEYQYMLIYFCERVSTIDDTCITSSLMLVSRQDSVNVSSQIISLAQDAVCLSEFSVVLVNSTGSCKSRMPPYSHHIDQLPFFDGLDVSRLSGVWYLHTTTLPISSLDNARLRMTAVNDQSEVDINVATRINGTCQPNRRYLARVMEPGAFDWIVLSGNRTTRHVRVLYTDYFDVLVIHVCQRLLFEAVCSSEGMPYVTVFTRIPSLSDDRLHSMEDQLRYHGYHNISDLVAKAGFEHAPLFTAQNRNPCSVAVDDNLCPIDLVPAMKKLQTYRFLGTWYVVAFLRNSASLESSVLKLTPGDDDSINAEYFGSRNGQCQQPVRLKLTLASERSNEAVFTLQQINADHQITGIFRVVITDYLVHALIYQCLQKLNDVACLPHQTAVEVLSRQTTISSDRMKFLMGKVQAMCIDPKNMVESPYTVNCRTEQEEACYVNEFAQINLNPEDMAGRWYPIYSAKQAVGFIPFSFSIQNGTDAELTVISQYIGHDGTCRDTAAMLYPISRQMFHFVVGFPQNNVYLRIVDLNEDVAVIYSCSYLNADLTCKPGSSNVLIASRSVETQLDGDALVPYIDTANGFCIDNFTSEFVRLPQPVECSEKAVCFCDVDSIDCPSSFNASSVVGVWRQVAVIQGKAEITNTWFSFQLHPSQPSSILTYYTGLLGGSCLDTGKSVLSPVNGTPGDYLLTVGNRLVEMRWLLATDNTLIVHHCYERDSRGKCIPEQSMIEVLTRNGTSWHEVEKDVSLVNLGCCLAGGHLEMLTQLESVDCPLEIEPECRQNVPLGRLAGNHLNTSQLQGDWVNIAVLNVDVDKYRTYLMTVKVSDHDQQKIIVETTFYSNEMTCGATSKKSMSRAAGDSYRWTADLAFLTETLIVIYVDNQFLITCEAVDDPTCSSNHSELTIFARSSRILPTDEEIHMLREILRRTCNDLDQFTTLYDRKSCTKAVEMAACSLPLDPRSQANVSTASLTGTWYSVARLEEFAMSVVDVLRISFTADGNNVTVVNSWHNKCLPAIEGVIATVSGDVQDGLTLNVRGMTVHVTILYADRRHLVTIECADNDVTGRGGDEEKKQTDATGFRQSCARENLSAVIYSRQRIANLDAGVISQLLSAARLPAVCSTQLKRVVSGVHCDLPYSGRRSCRVDDIQTHENFDINEMYGTYYLRSQSSSSNVTADIKPESVRWYLDSSSVARFVRATENDHGLCASSEGSLNTVENTASTFTYKIDLTTYLMQVLYVNAQYLVVHTCITSNDDLGINNGDVVDCLDSSSRVIKFFSRSSSALSALEQQTLTDIVGPKTCISLQHLQSVRINGKSPVFQSRKSCDRIERFRGHTRNVIRTALNPNLQLPARTRYLDFTWYVHGTPQLAADLLGSQSGSRQYQLIIAWIQLASPDKCNLLEHCQINKFWLQVNLSSSTLSGTWQVLTRSTFRQFSSSPETVKFTAQPDGSLRRTTVVDRRNGTPCITETVTLNATTAFTGLVYSSWIQDEMEVLTSVLYASADYLITLDCMLRNNEDFVNKSFVCRAEQAELTVYGRHWSLDPQTRDKLMTAIKQRTLGCYVTSALSDLQPNVNCDMPPEECSSVQFLYQDVFEWRNYLGGWNLLAVAYTSTRAIEMTSVEEVLALSGSKIHFGVGGSLKDGSCYSATGDFETSPGSSLAHYTSADQQYSSRVLYASSDLIAFIECNDGPDAVFTSSGTCPRDRTGLLVYSRQGLIKSTELMTPNLTLLIRERTYSCLTTNTLQVLPVNDKCPVPPPSDGGQRCSLEDICLKAGDDYERNQLAGTWFLVARSRRVLELQADGLLMHFNVEKDFISVTLAWPPQNSDESTDCVSTTYYVSANTSSHWSHTVMDEDTRPVHTSSVGVAYVDSDLLVVYQCFNDKLNVHGHCEGRNEHVEIFSRRRGLNTVELAKNVNMAARKTCFTYEEFELTTQTSKCASENIVDYGYLRDKTCTVSSYNVAEYFDLLQFGGTWYEVERTRYHSHTVEWESAMLDIVIEDPVAGLATVNYFGTRSGQCIGPMPAYIEPGFSGQLADLTLWSGPLAHRGGPWAVPVRFMVIETDYNNTAILYTCLAERDDGVCRPESELISILSRRHVELDDSVRQLLYGVVRDRLCVDVTSFIKTAWQENCLNLNMLSTSAIISTSDSVTRPELTTLRGGTDVTETWMSLPTMTSTPISTTATSTLWAVEEGQGRTTFSSYHNDDVTYTLTTAPTGRTCSVTQFACHDGVCIDELLRCDNFYDCPDRSDEAFCPTIDDCPLLLCADYCQYGYALDERGCETCECLLTTETPSSGFTNFVDVGTMDYRYAATAFTPQTAAATAEAAASDPTL